MEPKSDPSREAVQYKPAKDKQLKQFEEYEKQCDQLMAFFEMSSTYAKRETDQRTDTRLSAMIDCFSGTKRVYFHANEIQQLLDIIDFAEKFAFPFPVIVGGYDSYLLTRKLKDAKIPVMLNRIHGLPENDTDPVDLPYCLPKLLQDGEVLFCLQPHGDMEAMNARNLPFLAGTAWAYGLTEEQAIASISKNVCDITGIGKNYGTIEEGKSATFFISKGNALDMRTHQVTWAFVNGENVDLANFQEELYKRYTQKYRK